MMIKIRSREERGTTELDWLISKHTFSFDQYVHPDYPHFRSLRVINEDRISGGGGFQTHPHRDMEIITYVYEGSLEHQDSEGHGSVVRPRQLQKMSAGTGISHSEFNHSKTEPVSLLQIWIVPRKMGLKPEYQQVDIEPENMKGRWNLLGSPKGGQGQITIHQDVLLYNAELRKDQALQYHFKNKRYGWIQIVRGEVLLNNTRFFEGDGAAISDGASVEILCNQNQPAELLLFDLA